MKPYRSTPEHDQVMPLVQSFINAALNREELTLVARVINKDLLRLKEMTEKYLSDVIGGKELLYFRDSLIDTYSPAESYLEKEPLLWKVYEPFVMDLSLYEPNKTLRAEEEFLIGDKELKQSATTFLHQLNKAIEMLERSQANNG